MKTWTQLSVLPLLLASLTLGAPSASASPSEERLILRATAAAIEDILVRHGLEEVGRIEGPSSGEAVRLVRVPVALAAEQVVEQILATEPEVVVAEEALVASLPETDDTGQVTASVEGALDALTEVSTVAFHVDGSGVPREIWSGYVQQPAELVVGASSAREMEMGEGAVVAVLDTGIDLSHPLLAGHWVPGYDFLDEEASNPSDWDLLDESSMAILGESSMAILGSEEVVALNESSMAILGEAQAGGLDPEAIPSAFGHGTMVAGIVHLVAPAAKIMPLRVFDADGRASVFDISRAIHFAVDHGATVLNMSFSLEKYSSELSAAISHALANGVICVASVGNEGERTLRYPASILGVFGVASTTTSDALSDFSNYGLGLASAAAPGENVITAYPGGGWAAASGTSFAAPWISGAVALFADRAGSGLPGELSVLEVYDALTAAVPVLGPPYGVLLGRIDLPEALLRVGPGAD